jgi:type III secretory pathway component EscT
MMSGVMSIPLLLAMVLSSIGAAGLVTVAGYYNPFALAAPLLAAIGTGMLSTLQPNSGPANWISYQILLGIGIGCGFHQPFIAVQTVLRESVSLVTCITS